MDVRVTVKQSRQTVFSCASPATPARATQRNAPSRRPTAVSPATTVVVVLWLRVVQPHLARHRLVKGHGVALLKLAKVGEDDAALRALAHALDLLLEVLDRDGPPVEDHLVAAPHAHARADEHLARRDARARDVRILGHARLAVLGRQREREDLLHRRRAELDVFQDGRYGGLEDVLYGVDHLVDDPVRVHRDARLVGLRGHLARHRHIEAHDGGADARSELDVAFGQGADARLDRLEDDAVGREVRDPLVERLERALRVRLDDRRHDDDVRGAAVDTSRPHRLLQLLELRARLPELGDLPRARLARDDQQLVARARRLAQPRDTHGHRRRRVLEAAAVLALQRLDLAVSRADHNMIGHLECAALHEDRRNDAEPTLQRRLQHDPLRRPRVLRMQLEHLRLQ
mmetsp:Transcript_62284/g.165282  ORF Transcript_62284/g.165282 Transcript_62284/m.165282 type:complete len:402 (+) Transcript_62284:232-1437(+)